MSACVCADSEFKCLDGSVPCKAACITKSSVARVEVSVGYFANLQNPISYHSGDSSK